MQENKLEMKDIVPELLQRTEIPCMRLKLVDTMPGIAESKFGGRGYVPHDAAIPANSEGVQMRLLAQIDCRQITIPDFPTSGLLQFWAINDDLTGCNFDNNTEQKDFRICYYETIDPTVTEEEVAAKEGNHQPCEEDEEDFFPIDGCFGLEFEQTTDRMSMCDYRFQKKMAELTRELYPEQAKQLLADEDAKEAFEEELEEYIEEQDELDETPDWLPNAFGHKIGGYPGFSQWDPRDIPKEDHHDILLLQIDTDYVDYDADRGIMWGDSGVANFFISRENLKQRNFQDVIYTWDCC